VSLEDALRRGREDGRKYTMGRQEVQARADAAVQRARPSWVDAGRRVAQTLRSSQFPSQRLDDSSPSPNGWFTRPALCEDGQWAQISSFHGRYSYCGVLPFNAATLPAPSPGEDWYPTTVAMDWGIWQGTRVVGIERRNLFVHNDGIFACRFCPEPDFGGGSAGWTTSTLDEALEAMLTDYARRVSAA